MGFSVVVVGGYARSWGARIFRFILLPRFPHAARSWGAWNFPLGRALLYYAPVRPARRAQEPSLLPPSPTDSAKRQPRVFFGWHIVAASVFVNAILSAAYFQGLAAFILPMEAHFGWSRSVIGGAMSLRQLESGFISPLIGFLLDRLSARTLIFWSAVITGIGLIFLGRINGIFAFYLAIFIVSIGASGLSHAVTWPVLIARWFRRKRGIATGLAVMGPIFGSPFVILNTSLEETFGWRNILVAYGVVLLVVAGAVSAVARERPEEYGLRPDGDPPDSGDRDAAGRPVRRSERGMLLREAMRTREFWLFTAYLSGMFMVNSAFQVHQIPYFVQDAGLSPGGAAVIFTLVFTLSGLGRIGAGYMLDKMDYRVVLAAVAAMMAFAFAYLQVAQVGSVFAAAPFFCLFGVGFGSIIPMRGTLGSAMFGMRSLGSIVGVLQGGSVAAGVVGPIFMAVVFDVNGSYYAAMWAMAAVCALMIPLSFAMASPRELRTRIGAHAP